MAYTKLFKVVTDTPLPYTQVNKLRDNLAATNTAMSSAHGIVEPQDGPEHQLIYPNRTAQYGHHSDIGIPRSSLHLQAIAITPTVTILDGTTVDQHAVSLSRSGAGLYFITMTGLSSWFGHGVPTSTGTGTVRWVHTRSVLPDATSPAVPGIYCTCYEQVAGVFTPKDFDFWLTVYGEA